MKRLLAIVLALITASALAATTVSSGGNVVRMTANGDSWSPVRQVIKSVKVVKTATGKSYQLREGTTTGTVVWESASGASAVAEPTPEVTNIKTSTTRLYWVTDDTGTTGSILLGL